jgi:isopentenyl-diphosphate delta-isomerase
MTERVILVDTNDKQIGTEEKLRAHQLGLLHRAFSIFVFNTNGELLLQQRAHTKYHTGGLWTNTCCSHPSPGEELEAAVHRRLQDEMGFDCPVTEAFSFVYRTTFESDKLIEHEFDHVFIGVSDTKPVPNPAEVDAVAYRPVDVITTDIAKHPERYTFWFKQALDRVVKHTKQ